MHQESWIQVVSLMILGGLAIFYNPITANFEGKVIFFSIILATVLFLIVVDIYKKIQTNEEKIKLFNEKINIHERIRKLEEWKENFKNSFAISKKGQIDPRMLLLIIIIILIYLYIKSQQ